MLRNLVPEEVTAYFAKTLSKGYDMNKKFTDNYQMFKMIIGFETSPYLRRLCIEFLFLKTAKMVKNLTAKISTNKSKNSSHVELHYKGEKGKIITTVSHLVEQTVPQIALHRNDLSKYNPQQVLAFQLSEKDFGSVPIHTILTHKGTTSLKEIVLIVQNPETNKPLDKLPISIPEKEKYSDIEFVEDFTPEFIEFVKKASSK